MTRRDTSAGQGSHKVQTQAAAQETAAPRTRFLLAVLVLFVGVIPAIALADEAPPSSSSELPLSALEGAVASQGTGEIALTDPQAAEELPHQDLGREQAVELTEAVFEPVLQSASGPFHDIDVDKYLSDNAAVVSVAARGEPYGEESVLLESTVPLRTEDASGDMAPVDLELEASGAQLEPREPLVEVRLPAELGDGIRLPETGIGIKVEDAPSGRAPSVIDESVATYPNIDLDTDFSVLPTPTGVETLTTLRSADAPREQALHFELPAGADLRQDHDGAEVVQADETMLRVQPPFAVDANGESVPVSLNVSGDSLVIVASPAEDATYPILVDPIIEAHDWFAANDTYGQSAWHQKIIGTNMYAAASTGVLKAVAEAGYQSSGSQAGWYYWVPRLQEDESLGLPTTSYIARMTLWRIGLENWGSQGGPQPYLFAGIWGGEEFNEHWAGQPGHEAVWSMAGNGPETWMNPGYEVKFETEKPSELDTLAHVAWGIGIATYENVSVPVTRKGLLGAASVEVADEVNPSTANASASPWVNQTASAPLTAEGKDSGLGIKSVEFDLPWKGPKVVSNPCAGDALWPCPRNWTASLSTAQYSPAEMPQGFVYVPIGAKDVVGNKATPGATKAIVRVDHAAPGVALSGSITEQAKLGTSASQYKLNYAASDGDFEAASSLAPFGSAGTGEGKTQRPTEMAVDGSGNLWVVDRDNNRVEKFDSSGKFLSQFGSAGSGNGQLLEPRGIAISPKTGNIWIAEMGNARVQQFTPSGAFVSKFGTKGTGGGTQFQAPYDIAISSTNVPTVFVSDQTGNRVGRFSEAGTFLGNLTGVPGGPSALASFSGPLGLALEGNNAVWVADSGNNRIQRFAQSGGFQMQFGSAGTGNGQFQIPMGVQVAPSGNLLVTDSGNNRMQEFQPTGSFLRSFGGPGVGNSQLSEPRGAAFGADNTAFIADAGNHRIARWSHVDQDPQSGIGKLEIKVDGQLKAIPYNQPCPTNSCQKSGEWTYNAGDYGTGQHKVEVVAEDGVNLKTPKSVTIFSVKDATAPALTATAALYVAPGGWVEQKSYSYNASAKDGAGYGVTSLTLKIDGSAIKAVTQACPSGGCEAALAGTINMAPYAGGAHSAELIATDGAGLVTKKAWTINVAPAGTIDPGEASDTVEALEATDPEAILVTPNGEAIDAGEIAAGNDPEVIQEGDDLTITGVPVESEFSKTPADGASIPTPEGALHIEPVNINGSADETEIVGEAAAVTSNTATQVDTIIRPLYTGLTDFQVIRGSLAPEAFSWKVMLQTGQTLQSVDSKTAQVIFEDGTSVMMIQAEPARDATGKAVPTKLKVVGSNVIELIVSHKGGSFTYPVSAGPAFEVGYYTVTVIPPPPPAPPQTPPVTDGYWESADLIVGAPEPIPSGEATISTVGGQRKKYIRVKCAHYTVYESIATGETECGNPFTGDIGEGVLWNTAIRGAFLYKKSGWVEQKGAIACDGTAYDHSILFYWYVYPAYECHYGPRTSDGNGGEKASAGHYLRAQAHWQLGHRARSQPYDPETNPIILDDRALELHLWPTGVVQKMDVL